MRLAKALLFAFLQLAAFSGAPITPEQIEELMKASRATKVVYVLKQDDPP